jgi:hypothetical protein
VLDEPKARQRLQYDGGQRENKIGKDGRSSREVAGGRIGFSVRVEEERDPESGAEQNSRCQNMKCLDREVRVHPSREYRVAT